MKKEQQMSVTFPTDPTAPALVKITYGTMARVARKLTGTPGSGWETAPSDEEGVLAFYVDPALLRPHPKRKPRPDAASHLKKGKKEGQADAPATRWDGFEF